MYVYIDIDRCVQLKKIITIKLSNPFPQVCYIHVCYMHAVHVHVYLFLLGLSVTIAGVEVMGI